MPVLLSILIPTLFSRAEAFARVSGVLQGQIDALGRAKEVEIISEIDDGQMTIGAKRNIMMARAQGRYTVSVDDDDGVSDDYLALILGALRDAPEVDCLGVRGRMHFPTGESEGFEYSLRNRTYRTVKGVMTRPPHHLNPIKREISLRYPFEDVRAHEDSDVAMRMARDRALGSERLIDKEIYQYYSRRNYKWHRALAATEFLRHPLGIEKRNMLRLRRTFQSTAGPMK